MPENVTFQESVLYISCIIEKLIITHQEPIEDIKVWILLGYQSIVLVIQVIYLDIQVNTAITLLRGN